MTQQAPAVKNEAYTFNMGLPSVASSGKFQSSPTLAAGDVQISKDGGALANISSLPTATGKLVTVALTAAEMNADNIAIVFSDAAGDEWQDVIVNIQTQAGRMVFTNSGEVDANIQSINDVTVTGTGTDADPWGED